MTPISTFKKLIFASMTGAAFAILPSISAVAEEPSLDDLVELADEVRSQVLPMGRLVVSEKGTTMVVMSDNGRYRFDGTIVDTWSQIQVDSYETAVISAEHINLDNLKLDINVLEPLVVGSNEQQQVVAFVSPDDPGSRQFLRELPGLSHHYQFQIVVIPSRATPHHLSASFSCPADPDKALSSLVSGEGMSDLETDPNCNLQILNHRLITHNLLGFRDLPALIAPSTKIAVGTLESGWSSFLEENQQ